MYDIYFTVFYKKDIMNRQFRIGDIVQDGTFVSSIKSIDGENVVLARNYEVKLERLSPVEIRGGLDNGIILESVIPVRASIVAPGKSVPIRKSKPYIESEIGEKTIVSIVEANGFRYVHELQDWITLHAPEFSLRKRV